MSRSLAGRRGPPRGVREATSSSPSSPPSSILRKFRLRSPKATVGPLRREAEWQLTDAIIPLLALPTTRQHDLQQNCIGGRPLCRGLDGLHVRSHPRTSVTDARRACCEFPNKYLTRDTLPLLSSSPRAEPPRMRVESRSRTRFRRL